MTDRMEPDEDLELDALAALSGADLDRIVAEMDQEFWDDIERAGMQ